jgi:V/A-type H+/Na+-transporting ATPase subunit I
MSWLDATLPVRMRRVALVAPEGTLHEVLALVADTGEVEIGPAAGADADADHRAGAGLRTGTRAGTADRAADTTSGAAANGAALNGAALNGAALNGAALNGAALNGAAPNGAVGGSAAEAAFAAQLESFATEAARRSGAAALAGWMPGDAVDAVAARLAEAGGAVVVLPRPRGVQPPTLESGPPLRRSLSPLVRTYTTVPYDDVDPVWLAWATYVLMFGMMFGDTGEGALLLGVAVALRAGWPGWARRFRSAWPFVAGAGACATVFGLLYGEFFGPTGVLPALWLDPLDHPETLLIVAVFVGAGLLAGAYALGTVNRWREGGLPVLLYAPSGAAGCLVFAGLGAVAGGWYARSAALAAGGGVLAAAGLGLACVGFLAEAGGGGTGVMQAVVELFDLVVRLGSNVASFTRLAAFGLTHAALGLVVWQGTRALWDRGGGLMAAAIVIFAAGTALAFSLEALVAAVQALRLEYYELFSRVFVARGRPFRPWRRPTQEVDAR